MCAILCSRTANSFDPSDSLQVKYEMLRQVHVDKRAVSRMAKEFGLSRPSFYKAEFTFEQGGLPGLLPQKHDPRNGHKLNPEVMKFVAEQQTLEPTLSFAQLAEQVQHNFHVKVPPRGIEREVLREKNSDKFAARPCCTTRERWIDCRVRRVAALDFERTAGTRVVVFTLRGMGEWMNACSLCLAPAPTKEFTAAPDHAVLPRSARTEVVLILAGMLLHGCQERVS
jgi:hypothetical protein